MTDVSPRTDERVKQKEPRKVFSQATNWGPGFLTKLILMAAVNALGLYVLVNAYTAGSWVVFGGMALILVAVDYVYFSKKTLALKYLTPGLVFLLVFQIFVILYTGYVALTNYGAGHMVNKSQAIDAILMQNTRRVEGTAQYPLAVVRNGSDLGFAVIEDDEVFVGTADQPLEAVDGATIDGTRIAEVPGWEILSMGEVTENQTDVLALRVPISEDYEADGAIGTQTGTTGFVFRSVLTYDDSSDTLTNVETGTVYTANGSTGQFESADGETLNPGWRVFVGLDNFKDAFGDGRYAGPFVKVLVWTFAFAFLSVATTFLLGMVLAMTMNDERMRGRKFYRTIMLMPYAFPAFMTAFLFAGLLNTKYGFFNEVLFGGAAIPWLQDPWLAKLSVLFVNLWMGFPYMFLICTGALQSIPSDMNEAARIDGANGFKVWRYITMPQLMIQVTPLLISSFAFNFNNFNLIYMLTKGGPRFEDSSVPVGSTDILISMVYQISGLSGEASRNFGLASAMSIIIFIIVGAVSAYSFKRSRSMEGAQ